MSTHENVAEPAHATFTVCVRLRENAACEALGTESATDGNFVAAGRWRGLNTLSSSPDNSNSRCASVTSISTPAFTSSPSYQSIDPNYFIKLNTIHFYDYSRFIRLLIIISVQRSPLLHRRHPNIITTSGLALFASRAFSLTANKYQQRKYMLSRLSTNITTNM